MTVSLAIISRSVTVVASDGRIIEDCRPKSDDFDKTFQIFNGKILGVTAGLQEFCGKNVSEHIIEILESKQTGKIRLDKLVKELIAPFIERLENIKKINFIDRTVDVILAARQEIYGIRFKPVGNRISCDGWRTDPYSRICGNDDAKEAAKLVIKAQIKHIPNMRKDSLISLAERAIRRGITMSGPSKYNKCLPACGGQVYHRCI